MFARGRKKGTVRFSVSPDGAVRQAFVAGEFSGWQPVRMRKQKGGEMVAVVPVPEGAGEYKFILDGEWTADPDNVCVAINPFGTVNSVIHAT